MDKQIEMLKVDDLMIDRRYQRNCHVALVANLVNHYLEALFQPLTVSRRKVGGQVQLYVVDGQHRLEAARTLRFEEVPCIVYENMTAEQEAELFVNQQVASRQLTSYDSYRANNFIGNKQNIDVIIEAILRKYGHRVAQYNNDDGGWTAIVTLRETVKKCGADGLKKVLIILNELGWTAGRAAKSRLILVALSHAVKRGKSVTEIVQLFKSKYHAPEEFIAEVQLLARGRKQVMIALELVDKIINEADNEV